MLILSSFFIIFTYVINIIFIEFIKIPLIPLPSTTPNPSAPEVPSFETAVLQSSSSDAAASYQITCTNIQGKFSSIYLIILFSFCVIAIFRRYFISKEPPKNVMLYKKNLKWAVFGLFICTIVARIGWWYMSRKVMIGLTLTLIPQFLSMIIFVIYIIPGGCACEVKYKQWKEYLGFVVIFTVMITYATMSFIGNNIDLIVHICYSLTIAIFIIDIHVLSCNQIRVIVPSEAEQNEMEKRQTTQENHLFLGDSFMV